MNKYEFLTNLRAKLWALPEEDKQRSVDYYAEMIDDRIEEGMNETDAVKDICGKNAVDELDEAAWIEEVAAVILSEKETEQKQEKTQRQKRSLKRWEIALLILGSPLWLALLLTAGAVVLALAISAFAVIVSLAAVVFTLYVVMWVVILCLWVGALALALSSIAGILVFIPLLIKNLIPHGFLTVGSAVACAGIAAAWGFGCYYLTKWCCKFTAWTCKKIFGKRGKAK